MNRSLRTDDDAYEAPTALHVWPDEVMESLRNQAAATGISPDETAKMAPVQLDTMLRHESGMHRIGPPAPEPPAVEKAPPPPQPAFDIPVDVYFEAPRRRLAPLLVTVAVLAASAGFLAGRLSAM